MGLLTASLPFRYMGAMFLIRLKVLELLQDFFQFSGIRICIFLGRRNIEKCRFGNVIQKFPRRNRAHFGNLCDLHDIRHIIRCLVFFLIGCCFSIFFLLLLFSTRLLLSLRLQ